MTIALERVSSFTPYNANDDGNGIRAGASWDGFKITVSQYSAAFFVSPSLITRTTKTFRENGTILSNNIQSIPISGGGLINIYQTQHNRLAAFAKGSIQGWIVDGTTYYQPLIAAFSWDYPAGSPNSAAFDQSHAATTDDSIYIMGSYGLLAEYPTLRAFIARYSWNPHAGIPGLTPTASYDLGLSYGQGGQFGVHVGDDGFIYTCIKSSPGYWWKFNPNLTLVWGPKSGLVNSWVGIPGASYSTAGRARTMICTDGSFIFQATVTVGFVFHFRMRPAGQFDEISRIVCPAGGVNSVITLSNGLALEPSGLCVICAHGRRHIFTSL